MPVRGRELLTQDQRKSLVKMPCEEGELTTYYTFSNQDLIAINNNRRDDNRLGFAVQLCILRYPGWTWNEIKDIPELVLLHIAKQIKADTEAFKLYPQRENTLWDHLKEILK